MYAMVLHQLHTPLEWTYFEDREPGVGQIRVIVKACGVCRTDLHVVDGELPHPKVPIIPGHEIVGRVDKIGPGVTGFKLGERVGIPWLGHACGDEALRIMAGFLQGSVRDGDTVGRLGGEEFIILLPGMSPAEAHSEVEYLRTGFREQAMKLGGEEVRLTASFGIAVSGGREDLTWETLVREADTALYAAKNAGRNTTKMYDKALAAAAQG